MLSSFVVCQSWHMLWLSTFVIWSAKWG
jgi:hypothetical protein